MSARRLVITPDPEAEVAPYFRWPMDAEVATPVRIVYSERCLKDAMAHVRRGLLQSEGGEQTHRRLEVKGALLGLPAKLDDTLEVWVHVAVPLPILVTDGPTWCVYRAEDKVRIDLLCQRQYAGLQVVGWFHSHPNLGVFLSDIDKDTMERTFPLPHHIALVFDPVRDDAAFFVWDNGQLDLSPRALFHPSQLLPSLAPPKA